MKRLFAVAFIFASGSVFGLYFRGVSQIAIAGGGGGGAPACSSKNGDVNADGSVDLSDAVTILGNLFLGNPAELVPLCAPPPAASGLPDTGQRTCYDEVGATSRGECFKLSCPGQDASYATGCPSQGRSVDNGDETVTDTCTGLMWQQNTGDVRGDGRTDPADSVDWCDALSYCQNLSFAGHDDWRLPNVRELQSIVDYGRGNPSIDPVFSFGFSDLVGGFWSSTSHAGTPVGAWFVSFFHGGVEPINKTQELFVRAVRSGP
jgi:hypothetical protein